MINYKRDFLLNLIFCLLLYDITSLKTFDACINFCDKYFYFEKFNQKILLLGNKIDLSNKREISTEMGYNFAKENDIAFIEFSCFDFENTSKIFEAFIGLSKKNNEFFTLEEYNQKYIKIHKNIINYYMDLNNEKIFNQAFKELKDYFIKIKKEEIEQSFDIFKNVENNYGLIIKSYLSTRIIFLCNNYLIHGYSTQKILYYFIAVLMKSFEKTKDFKCGLNEDLSLYSSKYMHYNDLIHFQKNIKRIISLKSIPLISKRNHPVKANRDLKYFVSFIINYKYKKSNIPNCFNIQPFSPYPKEEEVVFQFFSFFKIIDVKIDNKAKTGKIILDSIGRKEILENKIYEDYDIIYNSKENILEAIRNEALKEKLLNEKIINIEESNNKLMKKINKLENELNDEKLKNQELNKKIKEMQKMIDDKEKIIKENCDTIKMLKEEIKELNNINNKYDKTAIELIKEKENEIKELKAILPFELIKGDKIISIFFLTHDEAVYHPMISKSSEKFIMLEIQFYTEYPEYKHSEHNFFVNGKNIERFNTLKENGIKNNDIITII